MTLSLKLGGREVESFDLSGTQIIQDCASIGAKIVRRLLTSEEYESGRNESPARKDVSTQLGNGNLDESSPGLTKEVPVCITGKVRTSWESVMQEVIPPYVKAISFTVAQDDLKPDRQEDLGARFPDVSIITETLPGDLDNEIVAQRANKQHLRNDSTAKIVPIISTPTTTSKPLSLDVSIRAVAEVVPGTPLVAATTRITTLSRMSIDGSEAHIKGIASGTTHNFSGSTGHNKTNSISPIMSIAERIGLDLTCEDKIIHAMWSQWQTNREVKSFAAARRSTKLEPYYNSLVTLYIIACHKMEFDLCFAVLLRIQNTNYTFREKLPNVATVVLAFQYLPENDDLCRWLSTLFAFLWGTRQYENREHLLADFPHVDRDAFCKFIFAVAYVRDPFTKGHNTAVLDHWCEVHHHREGDEEAALCKQMYDSMKVQVDKIRSDEAKLEYEQAKNLVDDYVEGMKSASLSPEATQSVPLAKSKRKAEILTVQPHKKYKKGGGRGGPRRASP